LTSGLRAIPCRSSSLMKTRATLAVPAAWPIWTATGTTETLHLSYGRKYHVGLQILSHAPLRLLSKAINSSVVF